MREFELTFKLTDLHYVATKLSVKTSEAATIIHGYAIKVLEKALAKPNTGSRYFSPRVTKTVYLEDAGIKIKLAASSWRGNHEVTMNVVGNKRVRLSSSKIETAVIENILLMG